VTDEYEKVQQLDETSLTRSPKNRSIIPDIAHVVKRVAPRPKESVSGANAGDGEKLAGRPDVNRLGTSGPVGFFRGYGLKDPRRISKARGKYVRLSRVRKASDTTRTR